MLNWSCPHQFPLWNNELTLSSIFTNIYILWYRNALCTVSYLQEVLGFFRWLRCIFKNLMIILLTVAASKPDLHSQRTLWWNCHCGWAGAVFPVTKPYLVSLECHCVVPKLWNTVTIQSAFTHKWKVSTLYIMLLGFATEKCFDHKA